jgi:hypothetical protein
VLARAAQPVEDQQSAFVGERPQRRVKIHIDN